MHRIRRAIGSDGKWVFAQSLLIALIALAGPLDARRQRRRNRGIAAKAVGGMLLLGSAALAGRARRDLAASFTMSPTPLTDATFVDTGIYSTLRHPMYLSVLVGISGYAALWRSRLVGVSLVVTTIYLIAKIRYEERQLVRRYPGYASYAERVPSRIIPRLY